MENLFKACMENVQYKVNSFVLTLITERDNKDYSELNNDELFEKVFWKKFAQSSELENPSINLCFLRYGDDFPKLLKEYIKADFVYSDNDVKYMKKYNKIIRELS